MKHRMTITHPNNAVLCVGGWLKLPECEIEFRVPLDLSDESFNIFRRWLNASVLYAENERNRESW